MKQFFYLFCGFFVCLPALAQPIKLVAALNTGIQKNLEFIPVPHRPGKVAIVNQYGIVWLFDLNKPTAKPDTLIDLSRVAIANLNEVGLLGLAYHPNYPKVNKFYVNYTNSGPGKPLSSNIAECLADTTTDRAKYYDQKPILTFLQPAANHNGGKIQFGPDSLLYIGTGDGGGSGDPYKSGQSDTTLLGKILRIDVLHPDSGKAYGIPKDNPYSNAAKPKKKEIYCKGMRNPWRFSWDYEAKRLWVADVGQNAWEEIDTVKLGGNYGWNYREADSCFVPTKCLDTTLINPVYSYHHTAANKSITGGYVYRGNSIWWLKGKYVFGDFVSGNIWALSLLPDSGVHVDFILKAPFNIPSFGEGADHELYVINFIGGLVYKFTSDSLYVPTAKALLSDVRVSPNPAKDILGIELSVPSMSRFTVELVSLTGQINSLAKEASASTGASKFTYYVGHLPRGSYVLQIKSEKEEYGKRIILE